MRKITKRTAAIATAVVVAVGGAGAAWAAWTITGTGSTNATAGSVVPITASGLTAEDLVPGSTSSVTFTVTNPNKFPVLITGVSLDSVTSSNSACDGEVELNEDFNLASIAPAGRTVPKKVGSTNGSLPGLVFTDLLKMTGSNDDCQSATYTFTLDLTGESAVA